MAGCDNDRLRSEGVAREAGAVQPAPATVPRSRQRAPAVPRRREAQSERRGQRVSTPSEPIGRPDTAAGRAGRSTRHRRPGVPTRRARHTRVRAPNRYGRGLVLRRRSPHARHKSAHGSERLGPGAEPAKHHDSSVRAAFRPVNPAPTRGPAVLHESGHVSLDLAHANSAGWRAAQEADGVFISDYARDFPDREDIAESIPPYFAVRYWPERLTETVRSAILAAIPNRLAYFDEQGFDMSPYRARGSTTRVLGLRPFQPRRIWRPFEGSPRR